MYYDSLGNLTGINNIVTNGIQTSNIWMIGTNQKISASSGNFLIDNNYNGGSFKITNYNAIGVAKTLEPLTQI